MRGRLIADGTKETPPTRADWRGRDDQMKAVVVYESLWGNTAEVARAIAEGIAPEARALSTAEATNEAITGAGAVLELNFKAATELLKIDLGPV
jgi:flavorubredoxin